MCTGLYAERNPQQVSAWFSCAGVVSGSLRMSAIEKYEPHVFQDWQDTGWSKRSAGRLHWTNIEKLQNLDLIPDANCLSMPVCIVVGTKDIKCPLEMQQKLYDVLPSGGKELHVLEGAEHNYREAPYDQKLRDIMDEWVAKLP